MDLTTNYLGLTLKNPVVPSASPLSKHLDTAKRLEDAGADMIECNFSCPQMTVEGTGHKVGQDAAIIQKLTDQHVKEIDELLETKEKDLMSV